MIDICAAESERCRVRTLREYTLCSPGGVQLFISSVTQRDDVEIPVCHDISISYLAKVLWGRLNKTMWDTTEVSNHFVRHILVLVSLALYLCNRCCTLLFPSLLSSKMQNPVLLPVHSEEMNSVIGWKGNHSEWSGADSSKLKILHLSTQPQPCAGFSWNIHNPPSPITIRLMMTHKYISNFISHWFTAPAYARGIDFRWLDGWISLDLWKAWPANVAREYSGHIAGRWSLILKSDTLARAAFWSQTGYVKEASDGHN